MNAFIRLLKAKEWSPYLAGGLLGLVYIVSVAFTSQLPGASGAFENLAGMVVKVFSPNVANNAYFKFVMPPGISWEVIMLAGIFVGSFVAAKLSGDFRLAAVPDAQWRAVFGGSIWKRWAIAFVGGIILEYGAGIAGGCTSGLAVGGGILLAPSAFLFIGGMFASGILVAKIMYRNRY